ncbi:hypothetical protein Tco_0743012, partial [Tanacetum coccineum]
EPMHTAMDLEEPAYQEFDTGATEDQPDDETTQPSDWLQKPTRLPSHDHNWNKTLPADHGPVQPWLSNLAREEGPRESFDELIDTLLDFLAFMMNKLKVDTLTPELLAGPTFDLMKPLPLIPNPRGRQVIPFDHFINNALAYLSGDVSSQIYATSVMKTKAEGDFKRLRLQDIEDMLILLVQGKLTNLNVEDHLAFSVSLRMFTRSIVIQRHVEDLQLGFIYQNKDKKNKLMSIDKLHKFSDGTLDDFWTALNDRLKGIRMEYSTTINMDTGVTGNSRIFDRRFDKQSQVEEDNEEFGKICWWETQFQNEVNDIRSERLARSANPLALLAAAQPYSDNYYQAPKPQRSNAPSYMQYRHHTTKTMTVAGEGETVGSPVVRPEMAEQVSHHCQAEQADWLEDTDEEIDEQELEAHYSYMAKIQEVSPEETSSTSQPLEQGGRKTKRIKALKKAKRIINSRTKNEGVSKLTFNSLVGALWGRLLSSPG